MCRIEGLKSAFHRSLAEAFLEFPTTLGMLLHSHYETQTENHWLYARIAEYYPWKLSFDTDAINALAGIFNSYTAIKSTDAPIMRSLYDAYSTEVVNHFYGIPIVAVKNLISGGKHTSFVAGMNWNVARTQQTAKKAKKRKGWLSWSWASFKHGSLEFRVLDVLDEENKDLGVTLTRRRDGALIDITAFGEGEPKADYSDFESWLDVTSWICPITSDYNPIIGVHNPITNKNIERDTLYLDPGYLFTLDPGYFFTSKLKGSTAILLSIQGPPDAAFFILLAKEVELGIFKRIGLLHSRAGTEKPPLSLPKGLPALSPRRKLDKLEELNKKLPAPWNKLQQLTRSTPLHQWRKKTIRLV